MDYLKGYLLGLNMFLNSAVQSLNFRTCLRLERTLLLLMTSAFRNIKLFHSDDFGAYDTF